jgi:hypothetical protein
MMRRSWVLFTATGLGLALLLGVPSEASAQWRGGWHGTGWGWADAGSGIAGWPGGGWGWNRGWAATSPYEDSDWGAGPPYHDRYYGPSYAYGYRDYPTYFGAYQTRPYYGYARTYGYTPSYAYAPAAPLVTGRSVAAGNTGMHCATSVKTCLLRNASYVGGGCSCRVAGGRAQGSVTP